MLQTALKQMYNQILQTLGSTQRRKEMSANSKRVKPVKVKYYKMPTTQRPSMCHGCSKNLSTFATLIQRKGGPLTCEACDGFVNKQQGENK